MTYVIYPQQPGRFSRAQVIHQEAHPTQATLAAHRRVGPPTVSHMGVSANSGVFPPNHPFLHRVFHYKFTIHFGVSLILETPI